MAANNDNHKRVLLISYVFPPAAYVGVYRTLKYCKYLSEHDWTPIVLTANPAGVTQRDDELCRQIPAHVSVHRTWDLDPAKWLERLAPPRPQNAATTSTHQPARAARPGLRQRFLGWAKRIVKTLLLESPDSHVFWVPFAFLRGVAIMLTRRVDVVYSSSPPHSSHLAGYLLARCFRKPHVVDFRDPWITATWLQAFAKRRVVMNAARIVVVSSGEPADLRAEFPQLDMGRVAVVTNGYDPDDFVRSDAPVMAHDADERDASRFTITHAGTIYRETGEDFFRAVEKAVAADPQLARALRVQLIGDIDSAHRDVVRRLETAGIVRAFGVQPHRAALALAGRSDVLLILQRGGTSPESHIPAKLFEYLFLGKPILAIAQPGSMTEVLTSCGLGVTSPPHDVDRLARTIQALYRDFRAGQLQARPDVAYISRFDRRNLTARFAHVLEEAASGG